MEKEFLPYDLALALKELGFDEPCFGLYYGTSIKEEPEFLLEFRSSQYYVDKGYVDGILAPTFSQSFRWFREKYNLREQYGVFPHHTIITNYIIDGGNEEEAELECLKKLIEIVKEQNGNF